MKLLTWSNLNGENFKNMNFNVQKSGIKIELLEMYDNKPLYFSKLYVNNDIVELIVDKTHRKLNTGSYGSI